MGEVLPPELPTIENQPHGEVVEALGDRAMRGVLEKAGELYSTHRTDSLVLETNQVFEGVAQDHLAKMEQHQKTQEGFIDNGTYVLDKSKATVSKIAQEGVDEAHDHVQTAGKRLDKAQRRYDRGVKKATRHFRRHAGKYQTAARLMAEKDGVVIKD